MSQALKAVKGVKSVKTDVPKKEATVKYDPTKAKPADLVAAVKEHNYEATVVK